MNQVWRSRWDAYRACSKAKGQFCSSYLSSKQFERKITDDGKVGFFAKDGSKLANKKAADEKALAAAEAERQAKYHDEEMAKRPWLERQMAKSFGYYKGGKPVAPPLEGDAAKEAAAAATGAAAAGGKLTNKQWAEQVRAQNAARKETTAAEQKTATAETKAVDDTKTPVEGTKSPVEGGPVSPVSPVAETAEQGVKTAEQGGKAGTAGGSGTVVTPS
jgi:hypothetical protein